MLIWLLAVAVGALTCLPDGAQALSSSQAHYLRAAERGVAQTHRWWNPGRHWYSSVLGGSNTVSLWGVVPLFEAFNGLELAQPSARHRHQLNRFAFGAQRYLNPNLEPVPGFGPKPGQREEGKTTWFDDNGWWGLAFLDAYQATGNGRWLADAQIAQSFISVSGWDATPGRPGGIWWNTNRSFYAGESLAGGTLLSARLYAITHDQRYLADALKFIAWGDAWLTDPATGLYARLRRPGTYGIATPAKENYPPFASSPMPYVNGPMILAHQIICEETSRDSFCRRAEDLAATTLAVYGRFWMGPQFDFWYVRTMLEFARHDSSADWYSILARNARSALRHARDGRGLYLRTWYGKGPHHAGAPAGSLQLHAANTALFAWMAALGR